MGPTEEIQRSKETHVFEKLGQARVTRFRVDVYDFRAPLERLFVEPTVVDFSSHLDGQ